MRRLVMLICVAALCAASSGARPRTGPVRVDPPRVISRYPDSAMAVGTAYHTVNITFDEPLDPATVTTENFRIGKIGGLPSLARTLT